jgi:glycosyltransferase involved in cell wall biosynthesis
MGRQVATGKVLRLPVQLLFVGRVETAKGSGRLLEIARLLLQKGIDFELAFIGDGLERTVFEQMAKDMGLSGRVRFHSWMPHPRLSEFYAHAHFMVLPTTASEGWPKVLSEGMAFGVVPLAGAVSSIPQILESLKTGMALDSDDIAGFAESIQNYLQYPERWKSESLAGVNAASQFTFQSYLSQVCRMFQDKWNLITPTCESVHG